MISIALPTTSPYRPHLVQRWRRIALILVLLLPAAAVADFGANSAGQTAAFELMLFAATGFIIAFRPTLAQPSFQPLHAFIVALPALGLLQWRVTGSQYPAGTLDGLLMAAAFFCAYYAASIAFADPRNVELAASGIFLFVGLLSAEAILQTITANGFIYWYSDARIGWPVGPFIYHDDYSACVELFMPIALVYAFSARGRQRVDWSRWVLRGLVPAAVLASDVLGQARAGLAIIGLQLLVIVILTVTAAGLIQVKRIPLLVGLACCVGFSLLADWSPMLQRFGQLKHDVGGKERLMVARSCLLIWRTHPWLGSGLNSFAVVYPHFRLFDNGRLFLYAHNDAAQLLAEMGVVGAAVVLTAIAVGIGTVISQIRTQRYPAVVVRFKIGALIGCIGLLLHACIDFVAHCTADLLCLAVLVALATTPPQPATDVTPFPASTQSPVR